VDLGEKIDLKISLIFVFFLCLFFLNSCGSSDSLKLPMDKIKKTLIDAPVCSVVLDDMKQQGTFSKTYFHKYLIVKPNDSYKTDWLKVPEKYFKKNKEFLGMALLTKKDGEFDTKVSPPGYSFVGNSEYGQWRKDAQGSSFWEFYGKYALFTSLFGGWFHPIGMNNYTGYRSNRTRNMPYLGSNNEYGSSGKIVKNKRPKFYSRRMAGKSSFSSKIGRTKTGFRSRTGGFGK